MRRYSPEWYERDDERDERRVGPIKRRIILWLAMRRDRREFRREFRHYVNHVTPMADIGNRLIDSWWVLTPLGLMCLWAILDSAGVFK